MFVVKDVNGKVVGSLPHTFPNALGYMKARLRRGETVWVRRPVERVLEHATMFTHHKDKVSRVRGKVQSARVGGQHSGVLVHKVDTGRFTEMRVW